MKNSYGDNYQYDSCVSRGICSVDPRTSSLQYILVLYLKLAAHYALKVLRFDETVNENWLRIKNLILNTISIIVSNPEFSEKDFQAIANGFNEELPKIISHYEKLCKEHNIKPDYLKSVIEYDESTDIIKSIQLGEKEFLKNAQSISIEIRDLYKVLFVLAKSMCTSILDLETFEIEEGYENILDLLNFLNLENQNLDDTKDVVVKFAKIDNTLMKRLYEAKIERYGEPNSKEVSYSTVPSKAILVVGSNLRELEIILENLKGLNIDVYTHDEMILAHTYPYFEQYEHLKGQFGQGTENCLLDFATFPGPIILTRHSLYNVDNLYRGRLYTTDFAYSKGIIPIIKYDFSDVIKSANSAKGFKSGKECASEIVGYNYKLVQDMLKNKIKEKKYEKIIIIGLNNSTKENGDYFENLINIVDEKTLVISLSYCAKNDNVICLNTCFDSFSMVRISEYVLNNYNLRTVLMFPKCDRYTISQMVYLSSKNKGKIFVGECTPILLNPTLLNTLTNVFGINKISSPKKDWEQMFLYE